MSNILPNVFRISRLAMLCILSVSNVLAAANSTADAENAFVRSNDGGMGYTMVLVVIILAVIAFFLWYRSRQTKIETQYNYSQRIQSSSENDNYDEGVDAEKELEWFRKAKRSNPKLDSETRASDPEAAVRKLSELSKAAYGEDLHRNAKVFQDKMKRLQYAQLPINSFLQLAPPRDFDKLPLSADPALLSAIEQANEEFEEDESVRELSLRVLAMFRARNSVDALSQIALYDLSSSLRSKAVVVLTDFDHESVFESIVLACADPTREVRAAAARGLFKLSFDRADAWKRIIASNDEFRMSHAARAATESGIVGKSFDRLLHEDMKIAYEAFALIGLLVKAGETAEIFEAIRDSKEERVQFALLHVLSIVKDDRALREMNKLRLDPEISTEIAAHIKETIDSYPPVMA